MKYLRKFNEALSESELSKTEEELLKLFPHVRGRFTINPEDGKIDVDDDIIFSIQFNRNPSLSKATKLPFEFGHVTNQFIIKEVPLTTLEGCPHTTNRFAVHKTKITDLVGGPEIVQHLSIDDCPITSLEGCPQGLNGNFEIRDLAITNLVGGPKEVDGLCMIGGLSITSLEGMPTKVRFLDIICPHVWDPSPLRNVEVLSEDIIYIDGPLKYLIGFFNRLFQGRVEDDGEFYNGDWWDKFRESLDYNYVRQRGDKWEINHFRFVEALAEFDFDPNNLDSRIQEFTSIGPYFFRDGKGNRVNLLGNRIPNDDRWDSFFPYEDDEYHEVEEYDDEEEEYDEEDYDEEEEYND